jgi:tetratricopeptide (TPR) repeat protein
MKKVFISYSSHDRSFAEKLAKDLSGMGVGVWFDQWEMGVGDSLIEKISEGIENNDFLAIILSPFSIESSWVNKELRTALCREIEQKSVFVLPILYQDCKIPMFLKEKIYADFRVDYENGLKKILSVVLKSEFVVDQSLDKQLADYHIKQAVDFEEKGEPDSAAAAYQQAIKICPDYDEAYFHQGVLYCALDRLEEAKASFMKAHEINPKNPKSLINLGGLHIGLKDWENAESFFEEALQLGASNYMVYRQSGQALIELGRFDEAVERLRKAIVLSPGMGEYTFVCILLYQAYQGMQSYGSMGYALAYLEEFATKLEHMGNDNIEIHLDIADQFLKANMPEKADEFCKKAMAFDSKNPKVQSLLNSIQGFYQMLTEMGVRNVINATLTNYEVARKNIIRSLENMDTVFLMTSAETGGNPIPIKLRNNKD